MSLQFTSFPAFWHNQEKRTIVPQSYFESIWGLLSLYSPVTLCVTSGDLHNAPPQCNTFYSWRPDTTFLEYIPNLNSPLKHWEHALVLLERLLSFHEQLPHSPSCSPPFGTGQSYLFCVRSTGCIWISLFPYIINVKMTADNACLSGHLNRLPLCSFSLCTIQKPGVHLSMINVQVPVCFMTYHHQIPRIATDQYLYSVKYKICSLWWLSERTHFQ